MLDAVIGRCSSHNQEGIGATPCFFRSQISNRLAALCFGESARFDREHKRLGRRRAEGMAVSEKRTPSWKGR